MPDDLLTAEEYALVDAVTALATTTGCPAARVVLAQGRLFTPTPWPRSGAPRRGAPGRCHRNALRVARLLPGAYVEGYALTAEGAVRAHAWCASADGTVLDPAWPDGEARAYLGVPMATEFVLAVQQRTLTKTRFRGVLDEGVQARDAGRVFQAGVPLHGRLDVGRPLASFTRSGSGSTSVDRDRRRRACAGRAHRSAAVPTRFEPADR